MEELERLRTECARLEQEKAELAEKLSLHQEEIIALSAELEETSKGVLALYVELDKKAQELTEISELKSRFLSYMSHEFRAPLGSIRSIARILLDRLDGPLTEEQQKQVEFVREAAVELTQMVDDLLDLAKIEAGRIAISPEWFELVDFFAALRGMFRPILTVGSVNLIFDEPVNVPRIYTDDTKLSQIIRNYISNALKFTAEGEVRVSALGVGPNMVRFSVSDTGIGIAKEFHDAIFEDFV
jgi:signal transduction histidine kinase